MSGNKMKLFAFRADDALAQKLEDMAKAMGLTVSEVLRLMVDNAELREVTVTRPMVKVLDIGRASVQGQLCDNI